MSRASPLIPACVCVRTQTPSDAGGGQPPASASRRWARRPFGRSARCAGCKSGLRLGSTRRLLRDRRGVAAVEFAIVAPILVSLVLVTVDLVQFLRAQLRMEAAAVQVAQIASQCSRISTADIDQFRRHAQKILGELGTLTGRGGGFVLSAVHNNNGANRVAWQHRAGDPTHPSGVGAAGGAASVGGGFTVPTSQTMLVAELFATVQPGVSPMRLAQSLFAWELRSRVQFLTRAADPAQIQQSPTSSGARQCTA